RQALERALVAEPRNADALAAMARYAAEDGDTAAAQRWTARLRAAAPNDPRLAAMGQVARQRQAEARDLPEARRLAQAGQTEAAVAAERRAFGGGAPPPANAREFYETLAGLPSGRAEAIRGLRTLAEANPQDAGLQLAYARALTYAEASRRDGIARLARLAAGGGQTATAAAQAWRQALLWLGAAPRDAGLYEAYLSARGADAEVSRKLAQARETRAVAQAAVDPLAIERTQGFAALESGDVATAEQRFQAVLAKRPNDADALGGLGLVRLRAERFTEAEDLLRRASTAAPSSAQRWREALSSARFFSGLRQAQAALEEGDYGRAQSLAQALEAPRPEDAALAWSVLAESLRQAERWAEAETAYRRLLAATPNDNDAQVGLLESLLAQDKTEEGFALANQLSAAGVAPARLNQIRAAVEHRRGERFWAQGDSASAQNAFQTALALRPTDPWIRYDYARFLDAQGESAAALGLMAGAEAQGDAESLYAAALFSDQQGRGAQALALISRIPTQARTSEMGLFAQGLETRVAIAQLSEAAASGQAYAAVPALRAYASRADLGTGLRGQVAEALYAAGDQGQALAMAQAALTAEPEDDPSAYRGFVVVLAKAGRDVEAASLIRRISLEGAQTPAARRSLAELGATLGTERAERLRLAGDFAGAFDALSQAYALAPQNPDLLASLGRLYQSGEMYGQAADVFEAALRLRPNDAGALSGLAEAALGQGDHSRARRTVRLAISQSPDNVELLVLLSRVEQAAGDRRAALRALEQARDLRERQMAARAPALLPSGVGAAGGGGLGPNPFARNLTSPLSAAPPAWAAATPAAPSVLASAYPWASAVALPAPAPAPMAAQPVAWQSAAPAAPADGGLYWPAPAQAQPPAAAWTAPAQTPTQPAWPTAAPQAAAPFNPFAAPSPAQAPPAPGRQDRVLSAIDQQIADLSRRAAPQITGTVALRARSGEAGLSQLNELKAQASISTPLIGAGRLALVVEPVTLDAGAASSDSLGRFGANPILAADAIFGEYDPRLIDPGAQTASGAGVSVTYTSGTFALDLGVTPLGFGSSDPVGGLRWTPQLAEGLEGRIWAERRAVTDSLTAYAGAKDPVTGQVWGEVRRTGAGVGFAYEQDIAGVYADVSANRYEGQLTADNESYHVNVGAYVRPYKSDETQVQIGLNLNHQAFDNNQNRFSLGHGGYFSPQQFTSVALPISLRSAREPWRLEVALTPGYETYREDSVAYFPDDPALQGQMAFYAGETPDVAAFYPSRSQSGFGFSAAAKLEYDLSTAATLGLETGFSGFGDYDETRASVYLKQTLGKGVR
ncbi:cellulose biosynthesis protein BcsC, partial [Phenylobacterium sp.]|uniref:cellulose biosynthesis protein BcsC n=1 Tax=Phenylobacterium sp. TaxID=1871053 RepID=UPI00273148E0